VCLCESHVSGRDDVAAPDQEGRAADAGSGLVQQAHRSKHGQARVALLAPILHAGVRLCHLRKQQPSGACPD
jgi:hypothetical protein